MDHQLSNQEITETVQVLSRHLNKLCLKHLDGCNSVFSIDFCDVPRPDPSDLGKRFYDFQDGLKQFLSRLLSGPIGSGFYALEKSEQDRIRENLTELFMTTMLEVLQPLQPSFYTLSDEGEQKYEELFDTSLMPFSFFAICIQDVWFILISSWGD